MAFFSEYKITHTLILINLLVYVVSAWQSQSIIDMDAEALVGLGALFGPFTVVGEEWWRLGTAMFLHGGMTHLMMNMFSLYLMGRGAERYFNAQSYLSIYFFSGLLGGLASLYMHPVSVGVGASGAIFGVFGALAGFFLVHRNKIEAHSRAFMKDFAIIMGINTVLGFSIESIDMSAHIVGLLVGFVGGVLLSKNSRWISYYVVLMLGLMGAVIYYLPSQYAQTML